MLEGVCFRLHIIKGVDLETPALVTLFGVDNRYRLLNDPFIIIFTSVHETAAFVWKCLSGVLSHDQIGGRAQDQFFSFFCAHDGSFLETEQVFHDFRVIASVIGEGGDYDAFINTLGDPDGACEIGRR